MLQYLLSKLNGISIHVYEILLSYVVIIIIPLIIIKKTFLKIGGIFSINEVKSDEK
jgi:hypothetical protein